MWTLVRVFAACLAALGTAGALGCSEREAAAAPPVVARRYIVGVDVSSSQTPTRREEARALVNDLVGRLSFGDELAIVETYRAGSDSAGQWVTRAPPARRPNAPNANDRKQLARFRERTRNLADGFFTPDPAHPVNTTDLLGMLQRVSDYAREGRPTTLLIVSDMLNSTPELNMERGRGVPEARWIATRKAQNRLPGLGGVCVFVSGADVASERGVRVREFWGQYFEAAGASLAAANYRTLIADAATLRCP